MINIRCGGDLIRLAFPIGEGLFTEAKNKLCLPLWGRYPEGADEVLPAGSRHSNSARISSCDSCVGIASPAVII